MNDATVTVIDHAKFASAIVDQAQSDLGSLDLHGNSVATATAVEAAIARLDHVRHALRHLVGCAVLTAPTIWIITSMAARSGTGSGKSMSYIMAYWIARMHKELINALRGITGRTYWIATNRYQ
jgi:hypothetical protein